MSRAAVRGVGVPLGSTERSGRSESSKESGRKAATEDDSGSAPDRSVSSDAPWSNSTFWILQLVILSLYLIRLAATVAFHLDSTSQALEFSTLAVFLVPVVYATLNFGLQGALFTAGWVTVLAVPRFLTAVHSHNYQAAWAELAQIVLLDALALLVGQRVTAERDARRIAEAAQKAHLNAEARYRDLFFSNQAPILIVDGHGYVVETNASAQRAFSISRPTLTMKDTEAAAPVRLVDIIGPVASGHILTRLISEQLPRLPGEHGSSAADDRVEPLTFELDGTPVVYRPTATMLNRSDDGTRMQIVLEDVTSETRRHDLMEAYAAHVVSGQEEERRHIAQEIHDGPVQALIHLCRQIDLVSSRADTDPEGTHEIADLRTIVEDTVAELRSIAKGLRPSALDDLGLVASIDQVLSEAGQRNDFETSFAVTGAERRLAPTVELALFRIAQEAISNIERHAVARHIDVGLDFEEYGLRLRVKDDGVGFEVQEGSVGAETGSQGLPGIIEHANLIGSRAQIHSERGVGTTVVVWVRATILGQK